MIIFKIINFQIKIKMYELIKKYNSGLIEFKVPSYKDNRGEFCKLYNFEELLNIGIIFKPKEHFHSISKKNVLRGMHFQINDSAHNKIIQCIQGSILDVCVDVRKYSEFYNMPISFNLSNKVKSGIYIPKGFAHGFLSLENNTIVQYMTDKRHNPSEDKGVLWNSIDFKWPINMPLLSIRDKNHPPIGFEECTFS